MAPKQELPSYYFHAQPLSELDLYILNSHPDKDRLPTSYDEKKKFQTTMTQFMRGLTLGTGPITDGQAATVILFSFCAPAVFSQISEDVRSTVLEKVRVTNINKSLFRAEERFEAKVKEMEDGQVESEYRLAPFTYQAANVLHQKWLAAKVNILRSRITDEHLPFSVTMEQDMTYRFPHMRWQQVSMKRKK